MSEDSPVPYLHLDAERVGKRHCYDAWREALRPIYNVEPVCDEPSVVESLSAWLVDNLIFTDVAFSRQSFTHYPQHVNRHDSDYLSLQVYRCGSARGVHGSTPFDMAAGEVHIFDFSRQFRSIAEPSAVAGVIIPHDVVGYDPGRHPEYIRFDSRLSIGRFLTDAFLALMDELPRLRQDETRAAAEGFCGLVGGLVVRSFSDALGSTKSRTRRREEMRSYVDRRLADPGMGVDRLSAVFSTSRASVYRDFAEAGGVAKYITRRRLENSLRELLSTHASRGKVQQIARRWGYNDPAHFSRLFRRRFGVSPSMTLGGGMAAGGPEELPPESVGSRLAYWLMAI